MNKETISVSEAGRRGGKATLKKHGRKKMREWGKLGGRPREKGKQKARD